MKARLILEDGSTFVGKAFGYLEEGVGEVIFNTSMAGYQEIITDPSNYGKIVVFTYPLIGNYGINLEDNESNGVKVKGIVVREKSDMPSNYRCEMDIDTYLKQSKVIGIEDIDTRALTKLLREKGVMRGVITTENIKIEDVKSRLDAFSDMDEVSKVTRKTVEHIKGSDKKLAIVDLGIKNSVLESLKEKGFDITIFPANTSAEEILATEPSVVFLSDGPGNPNGLESLVETVKVLGMKVPLLGECLGHELIVLAFGGKVKKMKFGHRGTNHPVKDVETKKIFITVQNHGYCAADLPQDLVVTHTNINDGTVEGVKHASLPVVGVQYSIDSGSLFEKLTKISL